MIGRDQYKTIREQAYLANMRLPELGLVLFTFGNVSAADHRSGVFAIKPSGVPYDQLSPYKMVVVDFEGRVVEGGLRPSSDTLTHAVLYKHWPEISGICHTHSTYATAWAQSLRDLPIYGTTHADHLVCDVPCAAPMSDERIKGDYELQTGFQILDCLQERGVSHQDCEMILVGNHAPFTWGSTADKAVYNSAVLEQMAQMALITEQAAPGVATMKEALREKHWERKHGSGAYYGQGKI